jgi:hypothetical protein
MVELMWDADLDPVETIKFGGTTLSLVVDVLTPPLSRRVCVTSPKLHVVSVTSQQNAPVVPPSLATSIARSKATTLAVG